MSNSWKNLTFMKFEIEKDNEENDRQFRLLDDKDKNGFCNYGNIHANDDDDNLMTVVINQ